MSNFSLFLALRYLKPKRTFVSAITIISILGPTLGVAVLIITISIMTGFERELKKVILGFEPHLVCYNPEISSDYIDSNWEDVASDLKNLPFVKECSPFVEGHILLEATGYDGITRRVPPILKAFPGDSSDYQFQQLQNSLLKNNPQNEKLNLNGDSIIISKQMARKYGITYFSKLNAVSSKNLEQVMDAVKRFENSDGDIQSEKLQDVLSEFIQPKELIVQNIFDQPRYNEYVFAPLHIGQELFSLQDNISGIGIYLADPFKAYIYKKQIQSILPENWKGQVVSWMEKYDREFKAIRNERGMMYLVLFVILIVASFTIMNTMITVTVQKSSEIGLVKAMGAKTKQIMMIFIWQGLIVGFIGTISGLLAGLLFIRFRNEIRNFLSNFGVDLFPEDIYGFSSIPAQVSVFDLAVISIGAVILCLIASTVPAYLVAKLDPAKVLRKNS